MLQHFSNCRFHTQKKVRNDNTLFIFNQLASLFCVRISDILTAFHFQFYSIGVGIQEKLSKRRCTNQSSKLTIVSVVVSGNKLLYFMFQGNSLVHLSLASGFFCDYKQSRFFSFFKLCVKNNNYDDD
jgi:hypothetical protein